MLALAGYQCRTTRVLTRETGTEVADDLIGERPEAICPFDRSDLLAFLAAEENCLVADAYIYLSGVDKEVVHHDVPRDGAPLSVKENLPRRGEGSGNSGGISDRQGRNVRVARELVPQPV